jgi:hypothetical protein
MLILGDLCLLLCFRGYLESHYVSLPHEAFVEYDPTINGIGPISLQLMLPNFAPHITQL